MCLSASSSFPRPISCHPSRFTAHGTVQKGNSGTVCRITLCRHAGMVIGQSMFPAKGDVSYLDHRETAKPRSGTDGRAARVWAERGCGEGDGGRGVVAAQVPASWRRHRRAVGAETDPPQSPMVLDQITTPAALSGSTTVKQPSRSPA